MKMKRIAFALLLVMLLGMIPAGAAEPIDEVGTALEEELSGNAAGIEAWDGPLPVIKGTSLENSAVKVTRVSGQNREATAIAISGEVYQKADTVVLASGETYADSLAGVPLAYAMKAPLLLVRKGMNEAIWNELKRLQAKKVVILGGEVAVKKDVEQALKESGYAVERLAGYSRFETAVKIAERLETLCGKPKEVFLVSAVTFPDALSVSSIAALENAPILYSNVKGVPDEMTASWLTGAPFVPDPETEDPDPDLGEPDPVEPGPEGPEPEDPERKSDADLVLIGGEAAIDGAAEKNFGALTNGSISRISGQNRYDTCIALISAYAPLFGKDAVCVASGLDFPDGLAGSILAAAKKAPVYLVGGKKPTAAQDDYLNSISPKEIIALGGELAVRPNDLHFMLYDYKKVSTSDLHYHKLIFTENDVYKEGNIIYPTGIVVHSTGANNPNLKRYVGPDDGYLGYNRNNNHWNMHMDTRLCAHGFIGKLADGSVAAYQTLPWNIKGAHAGHDCPNGDANDYCVGFEMCEDDMTDEAYFNAVYKEAIAFCTYICRECGINEEHIIGHYEGYRMGIASNHGDPEYWFKTFNKSMDILRADVGARLAPAVRWKKS